MSAWKPTVAQIEALRRMPDAPSDGAGFKGAKARAAASCAERGWARRVGRSLHSNRVYFVRLPEGKKIAGTCTRCLGRGWVRDIVDDMGAMGRVKCHRPPHGCDGTGREDHLVDTARRIST